jgi:hypothetical protein
MSFIRWKKGGIYMGKLRTKFKVEVNYPTTEEGIRKFEEAKARGVLMGLKTKHTDEEIRLVIEMLKKQIKEESANG